MFKAIEVPLDYDLAQFSRLLWQKKLSHRIHILDDNQILAVAKPDKIPEVLSLYQQWGQGEILPSEDDSSNVTSYFSINEMFGKILQAFLKAPLSLILIMVCCVLAVIAPLDSYTDLTRLLLYPDFSFGTRTINLPRVMDDFGGADFLKMISPMLLHAGLMHLAFNMLWLWEFGRRIESVQASWSMGLLVVVLALVSNTSQYLYGGGNNFGGMSGVVYGLFAYIWMWQLFDPQKRLRLPGSLVFFMLLSLGIITMLGLENIADSAHIGGLLCGVVYGALVATISRIQRSMKVRN
jgi:GlpG protein